MRELRAPLPFIELTSALQAEDYSRSTAALDTSMNLLTRGRGGQQNTRSRGNNRGRGSGRDFSTTRGKVCYTCRNAGRPANHDYKECYYKYPEKATQEWRDAHKTEISSVKKDTTEKTQPPPKTDYGLITMSTSLATNTAKLRRKGHWIWDSGSHDHITYDRSLLQDVRPTNCTVRTGEGSTTRALCQGTVILRVDVDGREIIIALYNVLYVP